MSENKLFVCPDQAEELEAKSVDIENTEVAQWFDKKISKMGRENAWLKNIMDLKMGLLGE